MGIYNRNGMIASLNESTRGFGPVEVCETFRVGDDLSWSCAKVCASIEEASNEWMREIGMEELEHATVFGEELVYEAEDASAKKNKNKFIAFISSIKNAVMKFFKTIRDKIASFFAKFKKKKDEMTSDEAFLRASAVRQAEMIKAADNTLKWKAAEEIKDTVVPVFHKCVIDVENYSDMVSINMVKEMVDEFFDDVDMLIDIIDTDVEKAANRAEDEEILKIQTAPKGGEKEKQAAIDALKAQSNFEKTKFKASKLSNDDVNEGANNPTFQAKYKVFKERWIDDSSKVRKAVAATFLGSKEVSGSGATLNYLLGNKNSYSEAFKSILTNDGKSEKIGNIIDNLSPSIWTLEQLSRAQEAIEKGVDKNLSTTMDGLQKQFGEILKKFDDKSSRMSETNIIASTKQHVSMLTKTYLDSASAFTDSALNYLTQVKTIWNRYISAYEKLKKAAEAKKNSNNGSESAAKNEGYNFFGAFESIR